jgi:hypothetical protein
MPGSGGFINLLRMTNSVPIGPTTAKNIALVGVNIHRALLIIQNNSTATSPDTAPTVYVGFGTEPTIGQDLALPPGVGIVLDIRVPSDAVYIGFGPFVNTGNSVVIQGVVKEGGISDAGDTANVPPDISGLIALLQQALKLQ